jgi:bisphosphoglycerate-dependent phosphoglycerate mutase
MREVDVYLIRHGESTSNVEFKILLESLMGFISCKNYSAENFLRFSVALWRLTFSYEIDSQLSDLGKKQAASAADFLQIELRSRKEPEIIHSCLIRAIETAQLMTKSQKSYLSLKDLNEANQIEHLASSLVTKRILSFQRWFISRSKGKEDATFVIFGHAQYFKYLLKKSEEMRNCDIWKVTARIHDDEQTISWSDPSLRYRSPHSYLHPIQVFKVYLFGKSNSDMSSSDSQSADVERTCRICQVLFFSFRIHI